MTQHIKFLRVTYLRGPNLWTYRPVIEAWVDIGSLEVLPSNKIDGFYDRLTNWLPGLIEHRCGIGEYGGFLQRLRDGTWTAHILEHVALELQNLAGMITGFGKTRQTNKYGIYKLVFRSRHEQVGRAALNAGRDLVLAAIDNRPYDIESTIVQLRELTNTLCLDPSTAHIIEACTARNIPSIRLADSHLVQLGFGQCQRHIWGTETDRNSAIAGEITSDKSLTKSLLNACGIPTPEGHIVKRMEDAWIAAQNIGLPVTIHTHDSNHRNLVARPKLNTYDEVNTAFQQALDNTESDILIEQFMPGNNYRLLIMEQQLIAAVQVIDSTSSNVTDQIHPSITEIALLALRIVGLDIAGIDLIIDDISRPFDEQRGAITGICSNPDLRCYIKHEHVPPKQVGAVIIDHLFSPEESGRIPVIGIAGSQGTTLIARLIAWLLHISGKQVGLACREGLYLNLRQISTGNSVNWDACQQLLINRSMESVVIENDARMILNEGLVYDQCAVGVVTDVLGHETLGEFYIDDQTALYNVLRTQIDVVLPTGVAVLNASDPLVLQMAALCDGKTILYANKSTLDAIDHHRDQGNQCVVLREENIVLIHDKQETRLLPISALNRSLSAKLECVLAAVAAAWALDIKPQWIITGLSSFETNILKTNFEDI